jgi:hypothetical protein
MTPWVRWLIIALVIVLLLILLAWLFGVFDSDDGEAAATTTTAVETTTSVGETTTSVGETTTSVGETTTSVGETTTTVEDTTTTTEPLPPLILADNGIGGVEFGASPEDTISYATAVLGAPATDTGWVDGPTSPYGVCPDPDVRGVEWGTSASGFGAALTLLFTNADTTHASGEHFFGYYYFGGDPALATEGGVTYGSTNAELQTAIPSAVIQEDPFDPAGGAWQSDVNPADMNLLWGFSTSMAPDGTLTSVNGGSTCGE